MIASWPFYLMLAGFSPLLMGVFGNGYDAGSDVVLILSLTMLLATSCGPVDAVLLMAGRSWLSLRNSVVALAVNVGLDLVLIPLDGIRGAAIAWSIAIVVRNLLPLAQVHRHLGMWPSTRTTVRVGALAIALLRHRDHPGARPRSPAHRRASPCSAQGRWPTSTSCGRGGRCSSSAPSAPHSVGAHRAFHRIRR